MGRPVPDDAGAPDASLADLSAASDLASVYLPDGGVLAVDNVGGELFLLD